LNEPLIQSMTSQLIVRMRDRILAGTYAPGAALRQDVLASEFGTSKIPVREALVQLKSEGLVDIFPNRGFQVRPLCAAELDEVFDLRLRIEPAAVAQGARLASEADRASAHVALADLNEALARGRYPRPAAYAGATLRAGAFAPGRAGEARRAGTRGAHQGLARGKIHASSHAGSRTHRLDALGSRRLR
jgi:DNA-binding GntR family transcriptional regulator